MSKNNEYEIIPQKISRISEIPKGKDLYYRCLECGAVVPSLPSDNTGCDCGNIFIDKDYLRLIVEKIDKIDILRKK